MSIDGVVYESIHYPDDAHTLVNACIFLASLRGDFQGLDIEVNGACLGAESLNAILKAPGRERRAEMAKTVLTKHQEKQ